MPLKHLFRFIFDNLSLNLVFQVSPVGFFCIVFVKYNNVLVWNHIAIFIADEVVNFQICFQFCGTKVFLLLTSGQANKNSKSQNA